MMADRKEETLGDVPKIGEKFFGAPDRRKSKPEQVIRPSLSKSTTIRPSKKLSISFLIVKYFQKK